MVVLFFCRGDDVCHLDGFGYMVADMVGADEFVDAGVLEDSAYVVFYAGQDDVYAFFLRGADKHLEVVEACGVDE